MLVIRSNTASNNWQPIPSSYGDDRAWACHHWVLARGTKRITTKGSSGLIRTPVDAANCIKDGAACNVIAISSPLLLLPLC